MTAYPSFRCYNKSESRTRKCYKQKSKLFVFFSARNPKHTHAALNAAANFPASWGSVQKWILDPKCWCSSILAQHKQSDISAEESCTYPGSRWLLATALSGPAPCHAAWYISAPGTSEEPRNSGKQARNVSERKRGCAGDHVTRPETPYWLLSTDLLIISQLIC